MEGKKKREMAEIKRNAGEKKKEKENAKQKLKWTHHKQYSDLNIKKNKSKHAQEHPRTGPRSTRNQSPS